MQKKMLVFKSVLFVNDFLTLQSIIFDAKKNGSLQPGARCNRTHCKRDSV